MCFLLFPLPPPWILSALTPRQLLGRSRNLSQSTLTASPPLMDFQPLLQSTVYSPNSLLSLVLQSLPRPAIWTKTSWPQPKLSYSRWKKLGSSAIPCLHGPALSTWFLNLMVPGDPVGIFTDSTMPPFQTGTLSPPFLISQPNLWIQVLLQT